ncbi:MAG: type II secretion system F family protein [Lachnospiraceae bacterium]|jgi:tight adherence protein C|nr:type II secretion system F family protein [Lachnospiraceae bacterium]MCI9202276.1 type II secretion system F family protein [Lachnospiraceae bacterium]
MQSTFQLAMLIPTTAAVLFWVILALRYEEKFEEITSSINSDEYYLSELFFIGFQIMEIIHFNIKSDASRKKIKLMSEVYGKKYAEYYYYVSVGGKITYVVTVLPVIFLLALLANNPVALLFGAALAVIFVWYMNESFKDKLTARREEILAQFPQVLSKMTLLVNSGMLLRDAWNLIANQSDTVLFQEMQLTATQLDNGVSEAAAYREFAERCGIKEVRKFASMIIQGLEKGAAELTMFLKDMADELWMEKRNMVKQKGEKANSKLLVPTVIIFIGILFMIMAPIVTGL